MVVWWVGGGWVGGGWVVGGWVVGGWWVGGERYRPCVVGGKIPHTRVANAPPPPPPPQASTYYWFCIMCKPRLKCSLGSLARLTTLS